MMERFRRADDREATTAGATSATATETDRRAAELEAEERAAAGREHDTRFHRDHDHDHATGTHSGTIDRATMRAARARQREEYGGIHWGAAFFGFLAAAGLAAILAALVSAAGATLTLGEGESATGEAAETIGIAGGIALLVVLVAAYFAGGYVAGRMSRFDGARQGLGVWLVALAVTIVLAAAGAILGSEYNVLAQLNLPRIPIDEGSLATGALIALAIGLVGSLLAALAGGKAGERYHRKIDRVATVD